MNNSIPNNRPEENSDKQAVSDLPLREAKKTRISTAWFMAVSFIILLLLLLIFILQNLQDIPIQFISFHWKIPQGIAMLLAAVVGGFLVALFGTARVVQLGRRLRKDKS